MLHRLEVTCVQHLCDVAKSEIRSLKMCLTTGNVSAKEPEYIQMLAR